MDTYLLARFIRFVVACVTLSFAITITAKEEVKTMTPGITLRALVEVDPHDIATIDSEKLIKECTSYLSALDPLSQSEKSKLHLLRGHAYVYTHRFADAVRDFEEASKLRPKDDFDILFFRNTALGSQGAFGNRELLLKAKADAENLIKMKPDSAKAYLNLAIWLMAAGDDKGCIAYCDKCIALDRNHPQPYFIRALSHKRKRAYQEALEDLDNCIKLGGCPLGNEATAGPFIVRATLLLDPFDNPELALRDLTMAHQINPSSFDVKFEFWHWYFRQGKYEIADYLSQKIATEYPKPLTAVVRIAMLIQKRKLDGAFKLAEDMIFQAPEQASGYYWRGAVHFANGEYHAAKRDYEKASSFNENNIHIRGAQAYLMASVASHHNAKESLRLAFLCCEQSRYKNPKYIMLLAMAHAAAGHKEDAVKFAKRSLELLSKSSHLRKDYKMRMDLFKEGKMYNFVHENNILDYLFF